jgi:hypothetical protein
MESPSRQEYLWNLINRCLTIFDRKRQKDKFLALGLKLAAAALSGAITVMLGLAFPGKPEVTFKNIALVLSAIGAALNTWDAFFNHRTLWVRHTITANKLRALKDEFEYCMAKEGGAVNEADTDRIFDEYRKILADTNQAWELLRKDEPTGTTNRPS